MEEAVFNLLFNAEWESNIDTHPLSSMITATLADYTEDISQWLSEYFFTKFLREILSQIVCCYLMALRKQATETYLFKSELFVARGLLNDKEQFATFFNGYFSESSVEEELQPIQQLARIMTATHISGAEDDAKAIYAKYHGDGLKLIIAAIQCNPSLNGKDERLENMEVAIKIFTTGYSSMVGKKTPIKYSIECNEMFANIDPIAVDMQNPLLRLTNVTATNNKSDKDKPKSRITWGRRKDK